MLSGHAGGNIFRYEITGEDTLKFEDTVLGEYSAPEVYLLKTKNISSGLDITGGSEISLSLSENGSYGSSVFIPQSLNSADTVFARFKPVSVTGNHFSSISHSAVNIP